MTSETTPPDCDPPARLTFTSAPAAARLRLTEHEASLLEHALAYANAGMRVFPVDPVAYRRPAIPPRMASCRPEVVWRWWSGPYRGFSIGCPSGRHFGAAAPGLFFLDIPRVTSGRDLLDGLGGFPSGHLRVHQPSRVGNTMLWLKWPEGVRIPERTLLACIRPSTMQLVGCSASGGGYHFSLLPPSLDSEGETHVWGQPQRVEDIARALTGMADLSAPENLPFLYNLISTPEQREVMPLDLIRLLAPVEEWESILCQASDCHGLRYVEDPEPSMRPTRKRIEGVREMRGEQYVNEAYPGLAEGRWQPKP